MYNALTRWSGVAAIVGGLLWILTLSVTAQKPADAERGPGAFIVVLLASMLLIAFGLVGLHLRQRASAGRLGTLAAATAVAGLSGTVIGRVAVDAGLAPALLFQAALGILLAGLVMFLVSLFRANVLPRGAVLFLVLGVLSLPLFNFGDARIWIGVLFGAAWIWLGYALFARRPGEGRFRPEPAEAEVAEATV
jgi:hypothetical protein